MEYHTQGGRAGQRYTADALIQVVVLADLVRNSRKLTEVVQRSARIILGPSGEEVVKRHLDNAGGLPGKSLVSRYRLSMDVAFMKICRSYVAKLLSDFDLWGQDFVVYMLADSSPRGGRDWLMAEMYVITDAALLSLCQLQGEILRLRAERELDDEEAKDELRRLSSEMHGLVWHHLLVPVALGLGETGLHQKFTALLHALRLEASSWRHVNRVSVRVVSWTTDYGTECGIAEAPRVDAGALLPHWREYEEPEPDPEPVADDADFAVDLVDDAVDVGDVGGQAVVDPQDALISFQGSIPVPGCLHMLHNALDDVTGDMPDFSQWLDMAKAHCYLIRWPGARSSD